MIQHHINTIPHKKNSQDLTSIDIQEACRLGDIHEIHKALHLDPESINSRDQQVTLT